MYLLDRLWRGEISPTERFVRPNSEYKKTSKQFSDEIDAFVSTLSPDAKRQMEVVDRPCHDDRRRCFHLWLPHGGKDDTGCGRGLQGTVL